MSDLRPFGMRVLVVDPPAAEEGRRSGLILPEVAARATSLKRGLVVRGPRENEEGEDARRFGGAWSPPQPGSVIYYDEQCRPPVYPIGDQTVVPYEAIVAVEETFD